MFYMRDIKNCGDAKVNEFKKFEFVHVRVSVDSYNRT